MEGEDVEVGQQRLAAGKPRVPERQFAGKDLTGLKRLERQVIVVDIPEIERPVANENIGEEQGEHQRD